MNKLKMSKFLISILLLGIVMISLMLSPLSPWIVSGTIVGFWTPEIFHGVSVAGYHLHFISDDHTFGGHVMDFVIKEGIVELGAVDQLDQRFPVQDRKFLFAKFNVDEVRSDMDKVE